MGLGIDGLEDMKLICGTRIAGMSLRTRKEDKVRIDHGPLLCEILFLICFFWILVVLSMVTDPFFFGLLLLNVWNLWKRSLPW